MGQGRALVEENLEMLLNIAGAIPRSLSSWTSEKLFATLGTCEAQTPNNRTCHARRKNARVHSGPVRDRVGGVRATNGAENWENLCNGGSAVHL